MSPQSGLKLGAFAWLIITSALTASCSGSKGSSGISAVSACPLTTSTLGSSGIQVYSGPGGSSYQSSLYSVQVYDGSSWDSSYTYQFSRSSVTAWHNGTSPSVSFSTFAVNTSASVKITNLSGSITSISVSPLSLGITPTISGSTATFTLSQNNKVWITINGNDNQPLFVFADGPKPNVPTNCNVTYFGPGVTNLGQYQATSGQTIYLDGGAFVRGNISVKGTTGVQIVGPGILSGDLWTSETIQSYAFSQETAYAMITGDINGSDGAFVSGITILDAPFYNFWGGATSVTGVKEISPWYWSTDGFEYVPQVSQVFAFVGDNVFFPAQAGYGGNNFSVTNSYGANTNNAVFCGGFWGYTNSASSSYSATMNTITAKSYTNGTSGTHTPAIFQIWVDNNVSTSGYANQTYQNITIEGNLNSDLAELVNMPYPTAWGGTSYSPALGNSYNFTFSNITLSGTQSSMSEIEGYDSADEFHNVSWTNLYINGTHVTNSNEATYFNTAYVTGLNFN